MKKTLFKKEAFHSVKELDNIIYWTTILVLVVANFFVLLAIIPLLFIASNLHFYLLLAILGLLFGYVFSLLIHNIENLNVHHHLFAILFVPIFAALNLMIIATTFGGFAGLFGLELNKDPVTLGIFYSIFFVLPYFTLAGKRKLPL